MDKEHIIRSISEQIYRKYPEMIGVRPLVKSKAGSHNLSKIFSLTYQTTVLTSTGKKLSRRVNVTANSDGDIQKITSSK
jgi:hypothetical protein